MWSIVFQLRRYTNTSNSHYLLNIDSLNSPLQACVLDFCWILSASYRTSGPRDILSPLQRGWHQLSPPCFSQSYDPFDGPAKFLDDSTKGSQHSSLSWLNPNSWTLHNHLWLDDPCYQSLLVNSPHGAVDKTHNSVSQMSNFRAGFCSSNLWLKSIPKLEEPLQVCWYPAMFVA